MAIVTDSACALCTQSIHPGHGRALHEGALVHIVCGITAVQIERGAARTARDFLGFWTDAALDRDQVARGCCPD